MQKQNKRMETEINGGKQSCLSLWTKAKIENYEEIDAYNIAFQEKGNNL